MQGREQQRRAGNAPRVSAGAGEPSRALRLGTSTGWGRRIYGDTKAQEQRNERQGWTDSCKEGKRLGAGVEGMSKMEQGKIPVGWRERDGRRRGGSR